MKLLKVFMALALALALAITLSNATFVNEEEEEMPGEAKSRPFSSLRGISRFRFLADNNPRGRPLTCKKEPSTCSAAGSPGPDCCKEQCVNVATDRQNCGKCNKKCKFTEECCRGECVYVAFDKRHCGGCNNRCPNGGVCGYGMCNYA